MESNGKGSFLMKVRFRGGKEEWITVDSGAEESVCPWEFGYEEYGLEEADRRMNLVNASGAVIEHYGKRNILVDSGF